MNISNILSIMVKSVMINQEWNEVKDVTTEIVNLHPPNHPAFVIGSVTQDIHHRIIQESLTSKCRMILKLAADTIQFTTQKLMWMETGPLIFRYKSNISPFTNFHQLKAILYTDPLYWKFPSLLVNKPAQVFVSGGFIFAVPIKSKADGVIGITDLCDDHVIAE